MKKILISAAILIAVFIYLFWCKFIGDNCPADAVWTEAYLITPFIMLLYVAAVVIPAIAITITIIMFITRKEI
jgi:hypothetical protein